jgi:hypothetical protein
MPRLQRSLHTFKADFAPEWLALLVLAALDLVWARAIGFHLSIGWGDGKLIWGALAAMLLLRAFSVQKGGMIAEYFSLTAAAITVFGVMSYLSLASSGALVDAQLLAADRGLGFNWLAGYHFLVTHPLIAKPLAVIYDSIPYQALYFGVLFALMGRKDDLRRMFWLVLVTGLFTSAGAVLFPAFGPFKSLGITPAHSFLPEMEHLKSGQNLNFALAHMTGVVSFPSFHTAMALAYVWAFRSTGIIGWGIAALNLAMLAAIPWYGGHYLMDMIAGAAAMLLALALVGNFGRLKASAASAWPRFAARYAGAYSGDAQSR